MRTYNSKSKGFYRELDKPYKIAEIGIRPEGDREITPIVLPPSS